MTSFISHTISISDNMVQGHGHKTSDVHVTAQDNGNIFYIVCHANKN